MSCTIKKMRSLMFCLFFLFYIGIPAARADDISLQDLGFSGDATIDDVPRIYSRMIDLDSGQVADLKSELMNLLIGGEKQGARLAALVLLEFDEPYVGVNGIDINWNMPHLLNSRRVTFSDDALAVYARLESEITSPDIDSQFVAILDEFLMSGRGMIFSFANHPIGSSANEYRVREIREGYRRIAVLEQSAAQFPLSRFAPVAETEVGNLFFEMYLNDRYHDMEHLKNAQRYFASIYEKYSLPPYLSESPRLFDDIGVRYAIATFFLGGADAAIDILDGVKVSLLPDEGIYRDHVYVNYFFPYISERKRTIYNSHRLIRHIQGVFERNDAFSVPESFTELSIDRFGVIIREIDQYENNDYRIVFLSARNRSEAEHARIKLTQLAAESDYNVELEIVSGGDSGWYGVSTVNEYSIGEAQDVKAELSYVGFPDDAYFWRPKDK